MTKRYEHTQVGYLIIAAMAAVIVLIGVVLANASLNWIAIAVLIIIAVAWGTTLTPKALSASIPGTS